MDLGNLKHIKLKQSEICPKGFNIIQESTLSYLTSSDSEDSPAGDLMTDDEVDEDECDFYLSESNHTTDTESVDEVPMKIFKPHPKIFPDELSPETDFVED